MKFNLEQDLCADGDRLRQAFREWTPDENKDPYDPTPVEITAYYWHKRGCPICKNARWVQREE